MSIDQDKIEQELEKEFEQYAQLMEEIRTHPNCDFADGLIRPLYDKLWQSLLTARRENAELTRKNKYFVWLKLTEWQKLFAS